GGGPAHVGLRSPNAPSMRLTGGQYLSVVATDAADADAAGNAASSRVYARSHASVTTSAAGCGARRRGLSSMLHSPPSTRAISARIAIIASQQQSIYATSLDP